MTLELIPFLKQMLSLPGLSERQTPIREVIADAWRLVDEISTSRWAACMAYAAAELRNPVHGSCWQLTWMPLA